MFHQGFISLVLSAALTGALPTSDVLQRSEDSNLDFSSYAPVRVQCPTTSQWVRPANGLSSQESAWVAGRKKKALSSLSSYLKRLNLEDFDMDAYLKELTADPSYVPTIGMAVSGGGWAPALTVSGPLLAFDDRFEDSCKQRTGGILQMMTYLSGLSGGSWPVMSLATNNYPTIPEMISTWHVDQSALDSPINTNHRMTPETLFKELLPKYEAGYNLSIADLLGRGFATEFTAGANGGLATMVSDIASLSSFQNHEMPFPMWQAPQGTPDDIKFFGLPVPFFNATIFEWNPLEFGAWQGPSSFFPTKYLGTKMSDGKPADDKQCIVGFDRASFMLGCAADAPSFWQIEAYSNGTLGHFSKRDSLGKIEDEENVSFSQKALDILEQPFKEDLNYTLLEMMYASLPNPFASSASINNEVYPPENLTLIDSSEGGQALPLWSQVQPARNPEFVMTWDDDEDALPYRWNNGTNLHNSYLYATQAGIPFPVIPPPTTFINRKYTGKPAFFGCDANLTNTKDLRSPIVMSNMNGPYSAYTNYTWTQNSFTHEQMTVITTNGFNYATAGNSTLDSEWPECLGCAIIDRSLSKLGIARTEQCQRCMTKYCWDGVEDNSKPGLVDMTLMLDPSVGYAEWNRSATGDYWPELAPKASS